VTLQPNPTNCYFSSPDRDLFRTINRPRRGDILPAKTLYDSYNTERISYLLHCTE